MGTIWTGAITMSIYHVVVYGVNQMMVQRTLAARTLGDAKKEYITMGYVSPTSCSSAWACCSTRTTTVERSTTRT